MYREEELLDVADGDEDEVGQVGDEGHPQGALLEPFGTAGSRPRRHHRLWVQGAVTSHSAGERGSDREGGGGGIMSQHRASHTSAHAEVTRGGSTAVAGGGRMGKNSLKCF